MRADSFLGQLLMALARQTPAFRAAPGGGRFTKEIISALGRSGPAFQPKDDPDASRQLYPGGHANDDGVDAGANFAGAGLHFELDRALTFGRAEQPAPPLAIAEVDVAVEDRIDAWRPLAEHMDLQLVRDGVTGLRVVAPEGAIETVLDAVLDNVVRFASPDSSISVRTATVGRLVEIAVRYTGPGIAADELEHAADRFSRSPVRNNPEGSGLELAIAAHTLEAAGGELVLKLPDRSGGPRVVARFPAPPESVDEQASAETP